MSLQWKLGRDQTYSLSGDCKRNAQYGTCIKYPDLEQCQSRFSLFKFVINVSTILISWIKSLFFSNQRHLFYTNIQMLWITYVEILVILANVSRPHDVDVALLRAPFKFLFFYVNSKYKCLQRHVQKH
jgi:hypothetical protein